MAGGGSPEDQEQARRPGSRLRPDRRHRPVDPDPRRGSVQPGPAGPARRHGHVLHAPDRGLPPVGGPFHGGAMGPARGRQDLRPQRRQGFGRNDPRPDRSGRPRACRAPAPAARQGEDPPDGPFDGLADRRHDGRARAGAVHRLPGYRADRDHGRERGRHLSHARRTAEGARPEERGPASGTARTAALCDGDALGGQAGHGRAGRPCLWRRPQADGTAVAAELFAERPRRLLRRQPVLRRAPLPAVDGIRCAPPRRDVRTAGGGHPGRGRPDGADQPRLCLARWDPGAVQTARAAAGRAPVDVHRPRRLPGSAGDPGAVTDGEGAGAPRCLRRRVSPAAGRPEG
jgi:hypothetical protein